MADATGKAVVVALTITALAFALSGCAGGSRAVADRERSAVVLPASMVLMPVGDERVPSPLDVDPTRDVRTVTLRILGKKGYSVAPRDEIAGGGVAAPASLVGVDGEQLAALGPSDAGALLFISITEVERSYDYSGESFLIELSAVIVDPRSRQIVWRSTGRGRTSLSGFMRIFTPQSRTYDAVYDAVRSLFSTVPKRGA
jgi:hypothetical protein